MGSVGRGGQIRDGGNLESRLDWGAAAVLSAKSPWQGLCGTCTPLVVVQNPLGARGACASFISERCERVQIKGSRVCVRAYTSPGQSSRAQERRPDCLFLQKG